MSKSPRKSTRTTSTHATANTAKATHPWIVNGIDYGPAMAAVGELATWAFDLAAKDVADWPEGTRRVRNASRFVLSRLQSKRSCSVPTDDLLFTAGLLARIFEAELALGMSEMIAILDQLGLPSEVVPLMPRRQPSACTVPHPDVTPLRPQPRARLVLRFQNAA